jgi:hypothetical protein
MPELTRFTLTERGAGPSGDIPSSRKLSLGTRSGRGRPRAPARTPTAAASAGATSSSRACCTCTQRARVTHRRAPGAVRRSDEPRQECQEQQRVRLSVDGAQREHVSAGRARANHRRAATLDIPTATLDMSIRPASFVHRLFGYRLIGPRRNHADNVARVRAARAAGLGRGPL